MANHQMREGDSVDMERAEVSTAFDNTPTSLAEQRANGGWAKQSPQDSTTPYDEALGVVAG